MFGPISSIGSREDQNVKSSWTTDAK
jgi:hypothetical protein